MAKTNTVNAQQYFLLTFLNVLFYKYNIFYYYSINLSIILFVRASV